MKIKQIYNFLFHPLSHHSNEAKILSVCSIVALTIFTGGLYFIVFAAVNWKDRKVVRIKKTNPKNENIEKIAKGQNIISRSDIDHNKLQMIKFTLKGIAGEGMKIGYGNLAKFEQWAKDGNWDQFHKNHYDWWMFPILSFDGSTSTAKKYSVTPKEIDLLKKDHDFMKDYRQGVEFLLLSWAWDLASNSFIKNPGENQKWTGYNVRLEKIANSLMLFGEDEILEKVKEFASKNRAEIKFYPLTLQFRKNYG